LADGSWCDPYKTWWSVYNYNPTHLNLGEKLYGIEAPLWSEVINP
jgi:hexosaminidase